MTNTFSTLFALIYIFVALDVLVLSVLFFRRRRNGALEQKRTTMAAFILNEFPTIEADKPVPLIDHNLPLFIEQFIRLQQSLIIGEELRSKILV